MASQKVDLEKFNGKKLFSYVESKNGIAASYSRSRDGLQLTIKRKGKEMISLHLRLQNRWMRLTKMQKAQ